MKAALINGSPKAKGSNSEYLLAELKKLITNDYETEVFHINQCLHSQEALESIYTCDVLVVAFPLYVDGVPSHMLHFLEKMESSFQSKEKKAITVYAVANCGFYEGEQTGLSLQMIEAWCKKAGLVWGQGVGAGAGEMLGSLQSVPIGHGPKKNLGRALDALVKNMLHCTSGDNLFISPNFPRFAFKLCAHIMWRSQAKVNGLTKQDLLKQ
jgi:multimeric flavodoxin WrbA